MNKIYLYIFDSRQTRIFPLRGIFLILFGFILLTASESIGAEWYVLPDGSNSNSGKSWAEAYATIQKAIDMAIDTDTVTVGDGIYTGTGNRDIDFKGKAIMVQSENGPEVTIIDCQGSDADKHRGFYFHSEETTDSVLDGFTIKNGYGPEESLVNPENDPVQWSAGGAIYCDNASPTIINNVIINNTALYGAGIQCWENSSPTVKNNIIKDNIALVSGGGVWFYKLCNARLDSNIITGNQASNSGGGVKIDFFSDVVVVNNIITNNSVTQPIYSRGGGIYSGNSHSIIANNTITQNSSQGEAGGVYNWCGWPTIVNSIVWGNTQGTGGDVYEECSTSYDPPREITASYSNIDFPGTHNIYTDPLFVNPAIGGFHLGSESECINSGDNGGVPAGVTTDFEGDTRITDKTVDMGADEYTTDVVYCQDSDIDGYFAVVGNCKVPPGQKTGDCDDGNISINPSATEIPDNSVDENCNGVLGDISAPDIAMPTPGNGFSGIAVDTNIVIRISDGALGVDSGSITVTVEQQVVPNSPATVTGSIAKSPDSAGYVVTFTPNDPFDNSADVTVTVNASDNADPAHPASGIFTFTTTDGETVDTTTDTDGDGITDHIENTVLHTRADLKTLFVRPLIESETVERSYSFWSGFKDELFPDPDPVHGVRNGFATVWPFRNRNIEVSIIGDPLHPYAPMQNVNYDPATDGASPPCDIMEVFYEREEDACPANAAGGHTYFNGATWSWDTKGLTPDISTYSGPASPAPGTADYYKLQDHQDYLKYTYHKARVYKTPLDNYVNQGAYTSIASDINPIILPADGFRLFCNADCDEASTPMNLIDGASGPPFTGHDGSVEFNTVDFIDFMEENDSNPRGRIEAVGSRGTPYARIKVLAKTTVHEMGHTLMNASNSDHCGVSGCIMTGFSTNWDLEPFGSSGCDHAAGGSLDVEGLIHNSVH